MLNTLDLFSGIGGFSLGLEATGGFRTSAFVEIDPVCRKVLDKHWPSIPKYTDIKTIRIERNTFQVLCGGFPCQDVSIATGCAGESILGDRSGLWQEYYRLITEGSPEWVIIENVERLVSRGLSAILYQLATLGYDAEWHVIGACHVGLPHVRRRLWLVAHNNSYRMEGRSPFPLQGLEGLQRGQGFRSFTDFLRESSYTGPKLCRSLSGFPYGMDRLRMLGNSVVPSIVYELGMAILRGVNK